MKIENSNAKIFYGIHFYPGVAQYQDDPSQDPYRVFLNEETLRSMDPTFAGKPIFVEHVDEVDPDLDTLRTEADGWVIESFFNSSDGKHWVKFIVVSERGERAIRNGLKLSNAYVPKAFKDGGLWNGVPYAKEITAAEYEHLALVKNPRYEESVIMSPDEFKQYNEQKVTELKKLSNSRKKEDSKMKFSFFKKTRVENAIDPDLQVILSKSGKSVSLAKLINDAYEKDQDEAMEKKVDVSGSSDSDKSGESAKHHTMADMNHMVKMHDGSYMKVKDMMSKHQAMCDEMEDMKKEKKDSKKNKEEEELDLEVHPKDVDVEGDLHNKERDDDEWNMDEHEEEVASEEHKMGLKDGLLENPEEPVHDDEEVSSKEHEEKMMKADAKDPQEDVKAKDKALQLAEHEDKEIEEAKKDSKKNKKKHNDAEAKAKALRLKNAHLNAYQNEQHEITVDLSIDQVNRGISRYGS